MTTTTPRRFAALAGLVATAAALSAGELAAGLRPGWSSPLGAVGDTVIELSPRPVTAFAIEVFGTADKLALIVGTLVLALVAGALLGVLGRRHLLPACAGVAAFGVLGGAASAVRTGVGSSVPSLVAAVIGIVVLVQLLRRAPATGPVRAAGTDPAAAEDVPPATIPQDGTPQDTTSPQGTTPQAYPRPATRGPGDRRRFLALTGGVAVASAVAATGGRALVARRSGQAAAARRQIADQIGRAGGSAAGGSLGVVADPLPPVPAGVSVDVDGMPPFQTPDEDFYRIDIALAVPQIDPAVWSLRITGMVEQERRHSYEELLRRDDLVEADITMTCVSNEVGGGLVSSGRWTGVPLTALLDEAGVRPGADQLVGRDGSGFTTGFPVAELADGRPAMLALLLDGEPLSPERGFPARVIVPGLYGYVSATKWVEELELTTFADLDQYWVQRGWADRAPIKVQSRIDVPRPLTRVPMGDIAVGGVAWAQRRGIQRVEIRVDDGAWQDAELADQLSVDTWRQWRSTFRPDAPGTYRLTVRATDGTGQVQTEERQPPFPDGASGWMTLVLTVTE